MLIWHSLTAPRDPREFAQAYCGLNDRFTIVEVRGHTEGSVPFVAYRVRDAEDVSEAGAKAGMSPKIVGVFALLDDAKAFVMVQGADVEITYRDHVITYWAKPIPDRRHDFDYRHDDFDGDEDNRCGSMVSVAACKAEIDEWHEEQEAQAQS